MKKLRLNIKLYFTLIFVYFVFSELILPVNNYMPKFDILLDSFLSLSSNYYLWHNLSVSLLILFLGLSLGFIIFSICILYFGNLIHQFTPTKETMNTKVFALFIAIILLLAIHQFDSEYIELSIVSIFSFIYILFLYLNFAMGKTFEEFLSIANNYNKNQIEKTKILLKVFLPVFREKFSDLLLHGFLIIIVFEFLSNTIGTGQLFNHLFENKDSSGMFMMIVLLWMIFGILIFLMNFLLKRIIFWDTLDE